MTVAAIANRGFNLLSATVLTLGGLTFGSVFFQEMDWSDKVDDGGFLIVAAVALGWYLWRHNRFAKSWVPVMIAVAAVLIQVLGLILERDDPKAFGDNIGGAVYFGAALLVLIVQSQRTGALIRTD